MLENQQIPDHDRASLVLNDAKSREIADLMVRRSIDILCLQETRWTGGKSGEKARNIGEGINYITVEGEDLKTELLFA